MEIKWFSCNIYQVGLWSQPWFLIDINHNMVSKTEDLTNYVMKLWHDPINQKLHRITQNLSSRVSSTKSVLIVVALLFRRQKTDCPKWIPTRNAWWQAWSDWAYLHGSRTLQPPQLLPHQVQEPPHHHLPRQVGEPFQRLHDGKGTLQAITQPWSGHPH